GKQQKFPIQWHDAGYCYRIYPNGQLSPFVTLKESKTTTTVWKLTLQEDRRFDFNIKILPYTKLKITFSEYKTQAS
ncbi:MAG: hypothetical protein KAI81_07745, partial [Candidatus Marinimicrobia bacterium]|nr:hypothetical protein [Candidatus Neomarinimicrobiota bacterium]